MTRREIREEIFKLLFEKELTDNNVEKRIEETIKENNIRKEEHVEFLKSYIIDIIENEEERVARVVVNEDQLSLAIGKKGQNSRLAAKLCGIKIDIHTAESYEDDQNEYEEDEIEGEE